MDKGGDSGPCSDVQAANEACLCLANDGDKSALILSMHQKKKALKSNQSGFSINATSL